MALKTNANFDGAKATADTGAQTIAAGMTQATKAKAKKAVDVENAEMENTVADNDRQIGLRAVGHWSTEMV